MAGAIAPPPPAPPIGFRDNADADANAHVDMGKNAHMDTGSNAYAHVDTGSNDTHVNTGIHMDVDVDSAPYGPSAPRLRHFTITNLPHEQHRHLQPQHRAGLPGLRRDQPLQPTTTTG